MGVCKIEGCERKAVTRGWCNLHYVRWRHNGDPLALLKRANGSGTIQRGYVSLRNGGGRKGKRIRAHILIAESALGKKLPAGAVVHHVNGNRADNTPGNLVVCPDCAYHRLLHIRAAAVDRGYPASYRKCLSCGKYDDPANLKIYSMRLHYHVPCKVEYDRQYYRRKMARKSDIHLEE